MIPYLFLLLIGSEYSNIQASEDSLFIYNTYKESNKTLENTTQPEVWYALEDSFSRATACAFLRLSKFNRQTYKPVMEYNKEGIGVAFAFPLPDGLVAPIQHPEPRPVVRTEPKQPDAPKEIAFKVLDRQTHFLISANGKTKTPYVVMNYYAKGRILVKSEKLNPITLEPIKSENTALLVSSE